MENLTPSLSCLYSVKRSLFQGKSLREALLLYINEQQKGFAASLAIWLNYVEANSLATLPDLKLSSDYQKSIIVCFEAGMNGQPIQTQLEQLIQEVEAASLLEVDEHIATLPLKALLPVFLFQFPAFLLLIFGPVLSQLLNGVQDGM